MLGLGLKRKNRISKAKLTTSNDQQESSILHEKRKNLTDHKKKRDWVATFMLFSLAGNGLTILLCMILVGAYTKLASRSPSFVQTIDGSPILASPINEPDRTPATIQRFVSDNLSLLMSWKGSLTTGKFNSSGQLIEIKDPGREVKSDKVNARITSPAWQASFGFHESYRSELVELIAKMTPPEVFTNGLETALVIDAITLPKQIEEGKWEIRVVGNVLIIPKGQATSQKIPFNKIVVVRRTDLVPNPPGMELQSPIFNVISSVRARGLQIYSMKDI
jgi:hypothetical protein